MKTLVLSVVLLLPCLAKGSIPSFSWDPELSGDGTPLLRIRFPDRNTDEFAVLSRFNPVPVGKLEREDDVDGCIFDGFLRDEPESVVTLTGCPLSSSFQVQIHSKRLNSRMYIVSKGVVHDASKATNEGSLVTDYITIPAERFLRPKSTENRGLSPTGYVIKLKLNYDDNWKDKFGADSVNAVRRVVAHAQAIWKWSSAPSKLQFDIEPEVTQITGRWTAQDSLPVASKNNVGTVNSNVYFCVRNPSSGFAFGLAYVGGACTSYVPSKSAIQEWENSDLITARALAHELGHNVGIHHDFGKTQTEIRYDSKGNRCTNVGGIMDYAMTNPKDTSTWSSCSVEDFTNLLNDNPDCMPPITSNNVPSTNVPGNTAMECQLGGAFANLNGVYNLRLNGMTSNVFCVNGLCAPNGVQGVTNGCQYICKQDTCLDAVDPGVCDMTKLLPGYSGAKYACVNGKQVAVNCTNGICTPFYGPYANSCVGICGSESCANANSNCW